MKTTEVFLKEMRELLRDKRVKRSVFFSPFLSVFILFAFFGFVTDMASKSGAQTISVIHSNNRYVEAFKAAKAKIVELPDVETAKKQILAGKALLVLEFDPETDQKLARLEPTTVNFYFNPDEDSATLAFRAFQQKLDEVNKQVVEQVLTSHNIPAALSEPLKVKAMPVSTSTGKSSEVLRTMLPYILILMLFVGGMSIAADMVAGEKEKGTLETLLISPVSRESIAIGKFFALCAVMVSAGISTAIALIVVSKLPVDMIRKGLEGGFNFTPQGMVMMLVGLIPTVAFMAGLMLIISTRSRNIREAQTSLGTFSIFITLPAAFSQILGFSGMGNSAWVNFVPVLNATSVIRNAVLGKYDWTAAGITALIGIILAGIFIYLSVRAFRQEKVLLRI